MTAFLADIRSTVAPGRQGRHGPLPPLLLSMTLVTGLVDAFSYLLLGHVFVANMTGNIVLLGFALAGDPGTVPRRFGHPGRPHRQPGRGRLPVRAYRGSWCCDGHPERRRAQDRRA
jgi:hypothetical protein